MVGVMEHGVGERNHTSHRLLRLRETALGEKWISREVRLGLRRLSGLTTFFSNLPLLFTPGLMTYNGHCSYVQLPFSAPLPVYIDQSSRIHINRSILNYILTFVLMIQRVSMK